jgi:glutamate 5-kinase
MGSGKRVVVKIGSSSLTDQDKGGLDRSALGRYADMLARLRSEGIDVVLVTSGAVASGFSVLGYRSKPSVVRMKQAAAAVGQGLIMQAYSEALGARGIVAAQVLLTRTELSRRTSFDNAFATLDELLSRGALPVINENDSVATEELTFGDNDILSAYVAGLVHADLLVIITDTDGIYDADPRLNPEARRIDRSDDISEALLAACSGAGSAVGTGGMKAKVVAARQALQFGIPVFIGKAGSSEALLDVVREGRGEGTFIGSRSAGGVSKKRQWIGLHGRSEGVLKVDDGAAAALGGGKKSLLPAGISVIEGEFKVEALVEVRRYSDGALLGRGVCSVSSKELRELVPAAKEGRAPRGIEVVHRDEWVGVEPETEAGRSGESD